MSDVVIGSIKYRVDYEHYMCDGCKEPCFSISNERPYNCLFDEVEVVWKAIGLEDIKVRIRDASYKDR